jgi:superfamily II DNA or RNA helicase
MTTKSKSKEMSVEDKYKVLNDIDHILLRPDMYIGNIKNVSMDFYGSEYIKNKKDEDKSDNEEKKIVKEYDYQKELDFVVTHERRNKFIRNLALKQEGNTLLLFQFVEKHGKILYNMISEKAAEGRKVFFVFGGTDTETREEVRKLTETQDDAIIVASVGTFSTGINIRNLHNIIFASPSKSKIRNLQSVGRGLRKSDTKDTCTLFDIADDLSWKSRKNFLLLHMVERIKIYNEEKLDYTLVKVNI